MSSTALDHARSDLGRVFAACRSLALCALLLPAGASAQEFAVVVSPPRFEDRTEAGKTYRNVVEITNTSSKSARFTVHTADWTLDATGAPVFDQALASGSCRPWVGIEANQIQVKANGKRRYRFEVAVPAGTPRGECRFAMMIEGEPQPARGNVPLPVSGRIGVIVYLAIGDAAPKLEVLDTRSADVQGRRLPVLRVRNGGEMHGRLDGYLAGVDAKGTRIVLVPDNGPILVGATRDIPLYPQAEDGGAQAPTIVYPLRIKGRLDAEKQRVEIDATLNR
jgi:fimbrial chaperone protein